MLDLFDFLHADVKIIPTSNGFKKLGTALLGVALHFFSPPTSLALSLFLNIFPFFCISCIWGLLKRFLKVSTLISLFFFDLLLTTITNKGKDMENSEIETNKKHKHTNKWKNQMTDG